MSSVMKGEWIGNICGPEVLRFGSTTTVLDRLNNMGYSLAEGPTVMPNPSSSAMGKPTPFILGTDSLEMSPQPSQEPELKTPQPIVMRHPIL